MATDLSDLLVPELIVVGMTAASKKTLFAQLGTLVAPALAGESIPAGQLSKTFTVTLNGDAGVEPNETFRVTLSNISANATLFKYIGTGTITNDD